MRKLFLTLFVVGVTLVGCQKESNEPKKPNNIENQSNNEPKRPKTKVVYEALQVQKQQVFYLNSATYLGFDKKTRTTIPLKLPKNTVSFYYAISTASGKTPTEEVKLLTQVTSALTGLVPLSAIINKIEIPQANTPGRVDVVLLSKDEEDNFLNKDDYKYFPEGSRESLISGTIEVSQIGDVKIENVDLSNFFYVGLRNPRTTTGTNISFEAVAIVKKEVTVYE